MPYFHFLLSSVFEMKEHDMEGKEEEDVKAVEGAGLRRKGVWD